MGMKLKSGADLCGFELSRFCVQNDVAIPDAPASGRKYFHTGTGMEGKYSLLGRERIYTGTAWRAAAYVDDLANLDITSNEDFLALKTKVEAFLDGEVDSNGVLDNLKEIQKFLDNYSSATDLTDILNTKLDKKGGTISGSSATPLLIDTSYTSSVIGFQSNGIDKSYVGYSPARGAHLYNYASNVYFGVNDDGTPFYNEHTLIHSGNIGSQTVEAARKLVTSAGEDAATVSNDKIVTFDTHIRCGINYFRNNDGEFKSWLGRGSSTSDDIILHIPTANGFRVYTNGTGRFFINSSGNVTIGEHDYAKDSNLIKLCIDGRLAMLKNGTQCAVLGFSDSILALGYSNVTDYDVRINGFNITLMPQGGSVGINTKTPRYTLDVDGTLGVSDIASFAKRVNVGGATDNENYALNVKGRIKSSQDIIAEGTIACKGVAEVGDAAGMGTVDKWIGMVDKATNSQVYTHGLNTEDVTVSIYEKNGSEWVLVLTDVDIVDQNRIRVMFGTTPTIDHKIVVMG